MGHWHVRGQHAQLRAAVLTTMYRRDAGSVCIRYQRSPYQPRCHIRELPLPQVPVEGLPHLRCGSGAWRFLCIWSRVRQLQVGYRYLRRWPGYQNCWSAQRNSMGFKRLTEQSVGSRILSKCLSRHLLHVSCGIHDQDGKHVGSACT